MVVKTPSTDVVISDDAMKFAQEHRILEYVETAMKAAREVFTDARSITARLKRDPQYGDWYVDVHVVLRDEEEPDTEAERYSDCLGKWVTLARAFFMAGICGAMGGRSAISVTSIFPMAKRRWASSAQTRANSNWESISL